MRQSSIRGLRTFCVAARHLSFKAAAEELCVTPSAVSHQIKGLEQQLNTQLFERRTREVALTEIGAGLFAQLDPLLTELDNVTARFLVRNGQRRILKITLLPFFASEMFIPRLSAFADRHRAIDMRVETTEAGALHPAASDASILLLPHRPPDVNAHPLFTLRLAPACSPQLARELKLGDPRGLLGSTLIVHKSRPQAWHDWFASMSIALERQPKVIHLDSMFAVARAAERGLGVALVPIPLASSWFTSGALVRPCIGELETNDTYYFVYRNDAAQNPDVCALRDWVTATFTQERDERISAVA
ncbi:MAG TPA: LysR substrate-binding domain-containing protein [Gammaproteobacteria bacterium]|nr:LysR substrate-binding domain-containing protein [Gammaproteobacteria bacterium]